MDTFLDRGARLDDLVHDGIGHMVDDMLVHLEQIEEGHGVQAGLGIPRIEVTGALEDVPLLLPLIAEPPGDILELLVLEQSPYQFLPRIADAVLEGFISLYVTWQKHLGLHLHQRRRHEDEVGGLLEVEQMHAGAQERQVLVRDRGDGDVVDVHLILADEVEKQVQRPLENTEADPVGIVGSIGVAAWFDRRMISQGRGMVSSAGR